MDFQQSRTYQNLLQAYETDLKTSAKYELYSMQAGREQLIEVSNVFERTAGNERIIAETWLRIINDGVLPNTQQNLIEASGSAINEANSILKEYSNIAIEEGYNDIAALFNGVANIELNHNYFFETFSNDIESNEMFCKREEVLWICLSCGNILSGICAPERCPICQFPQGYYTLYTC